MTRAAAVIALALAAAPARGAAPVAWTAEQNLSQTLTDTETGLNHRPLAATPDGALHVAWAERDSPTSQYRIWTRRHDGAGWSAPELVVDWPASDPGDPGDDIGAKYPALAATPDGDVHLFWHDYRVAGIDNVEIFTKTRPAGGAWDSSRAADVRLTTTDHPETGGDNGYVPVPAVAPDGALHVVWWDYRYDGDRAEILAKTRPAGGAWNLAPGDSADERVTTDSDHSELPAIAVDGAGRVHVAWRSVGAGASVHWAMRDTAGSWSAPEDIDLGGLVQGAPALAVDGNDAVHVVWPDARAGGRALFARTRTAGGWSGTVEEITDPAHAADEPSLAVDADGALQLVWSDARFGFFDREIFHRTKPPGSGWNASPDFRVSNADRQSVRPGVLAHGNFVSITWRDERTGDRELWYRRGGPAGTGVADAPAAAGGWTAFPNPARGAVRFRRPGEASGRDLVVLDVAGRIVRRLAARGGEVVWDGRGGAGARVPAGVYFVREVGTRDALRVTVLR